MKRLGLILSVAALSACTTVYDAGRGTGPAPDDVLALPLPADPGPAPDARTAARNFVSVVERLEPVVEQECRLEARQSDCDFRIVVDDRRGQPPNAYQTLDQNGRPVIAFTLALIADARNVDELAFIMGHEAAHHILGHIGRQQQTAMTTAILGGVIAAASGADPSTVRAAQELGASVGARTYSKDFELEADRLGAAIAISAGYDPVRGIAFFQRIPDPGNVFLGSHPPNEDRIRAVLQTARRLGTGA